MRSLLFPSRRTTGAGALARLYDGAAKSWQRGLNQIGFGPAYAALCQAAQDRHPQTGPARILDAGAGTGALSSAYAATTSHPCQFDLLDLSAEMLSVATAQLGPRATAVLGGLGDAALPRDTYDRVLCGHVIEHCEDPQAALDWLWTRLTPGGVAVFALSKPHWCTALVRWKYGSAAFRPEDVDLMLTRAGFLDLVRVPFASGPPSRISCGYLAMRPT